MFMSMSKTENLIIIMLISILLIPVYTSTYSSHASFSIIIKSTTTHFFLFFSLRELRIKGITFFSLSLPPSFPHRQQSPFLLCMPLSPLCLLFFQCIIAIFYRNSQWEPLQRREHQKPTILHYLMLQKTLQTNTKSTTKNNNLLFYA